MKKRTFSLFLACLFVIVLLPSSARAEAAPTEQSVTQAILALKSWYPEGTPWTDANNRYTWMVPNESIIGTGCAAFAFMASDAAFGTNVFPVTKVDNVRFSDVRAGDILRMNQDTHTVIIVTVNADSVTIAEGNYNKSVHWGRTLSKAEVESSDYMFTRYPDKKSSVVDPCANGHTWGGWIVVRAATCTVDSIQSHTCTVCNATESRTVNALGHSYQNGVCVRCGEAQPGYNPCAKGHTWGSWTVIRPATCTVDSIHAHTCTVCNTTENRIVSALGHDYQNGTCTRCNAVDPKASKTASNANNANNANNGNNAKNANNGSNGNNGVHFKKVSTFTQGQFKDLNPSDWFVPSIASAMEYGLMKGYANGTFSPNENVTVAQVIAMAARIHSIYTTGSENFVQTNPVLWYQCYLDYAYKNGIISSAYYTGDPEKKATRAQFAEIFAKSLPASGLPVINTVADNAIPDVKTSDSYAPYVYQLYRAGILNGRNSRGAFFPNSNITRAECATIVSRMAESSNRISITLN